jgi:hypothetical protein
MVDLTTYADAMGLVDRTGYSYVVRSVDLADGAEDTNLVEHQGAQAPLPGERRCQRLGKRLVRRQRDDRQLRHGRGLLDGMRATARGSAGASQPGP